MRTGETYVLCAVSMNGMGKYFANENSFLIMFFDGHAGTAQQWSIVILFKLIICAWGVCGSREYNAKFPRNFPLA